MAIPIELFVLAASYVLLFVGLIFEPLKIMRSLGSMAVMVMGIFTLYPGIPGLDRAGLMALTIGTISIGVGFYFLIAGSFSYDRQVGNYDQEDDGRFHG